MLQISDYPLEPHYPTTEDGYILTLFRFMVNPPNSTGNSSESTRPPVLLVHGMMCSGTEWLSNSPEKVLPFMLAQEGYDVWIGCLRGSRLTGPQAHVKYTMKQNKYWDFSVDEYGYYDIPCMIDHILKETQEPNLFYVGHSLGSTAVLLALSSRPEYNDKVRCIAAMTPAVYGENCRNFWLSKLSAPIYSCLGKFRFIYERNVCQSSVRELVKKYWPCLPKKDAICAQIFRFYAVFILKISHSDQVENERLPQLFEILPGRSSMKMVCHVMQALYYNKPQRYDYGRNGNMTKYGQPVPPEYTLENVVAPVALYSSDHDYLIGEQDILRISKELKNVIKYKTIVGNFGHMDFMVGKDAHTLVYPDIIEVFKKFRQTDKLSQHADEISINF